MHSFFVSTSEEKVISEPQSRHKCVFVDNSLLILQQLALLYDLCQVVVHDQPQRLRCAFCDVCARKVAQTLSEGRVKETVKLRLWNLLEETISHHFLAHPSCCINPTQKLLIYLLLLRQPLLHRHPLLHTTLHLKWKYRGVVSTPNGGESV